MVHPQVADGGQLGIYSISSLRQTTRGGPPVWGLGVGLTTLHCKKAPIWTDSLNKQPK
jgi:hypothetical protein